MVVRHPSVYGVSQGARQGNRGDVQRPLYGLPSGGRPPDSPWRRDLPVSRRDGQTGREAAAAVRGQPFGDGGRTRDRKSTRLNSSHSQISYAVFCLKKKKKNTIDNRWLKP